MTDLDKLDALAAAATEAAGVSEFDGIEARAALYREADPATIRDLVAAVRERDELRAALEVTTRWFDMLETEQQPALRKAFLVLRAALHPEDET